MSIKEGFAFNGKVLSGIFEIDKPIILDSGPMLSKVKEIVKDFRNTTEYENENLGHYVKKANNYFTSIGMRYLYFGVLLGLPHIYIGNDNEEQAEIKIEIDSTEVDEITFHIYNRIFYKNPKKVSVAVKNDGKVQSVVYRTLLYYILDCICRSTQIFLLNKNSVISINEEFIRNGLKLSESEMKIFVDFIDVTSKLRLSLFLIPIRNMFVKAEAAGDNDEFLLNRIRSSKSLDFYKKIYDEITKSSGKKEIKESLHDSLLFGLSIIPDDFRKKILL